MSIKIPIETSARHIHVSRKDFEFLFGRDSELHYTKELSQPGQYLCQERLSVLGPKGTFENIAILGPFRKETQTQESLESPAVSVSPAILRELPAVSCGAPAASFQYRKASSWQSATSI